MDLLKKTPSADLTEPSQSTGDFLDLYRILRGQIEHEDNLVGSRISWFVTSQSFLFSAYAIVASSIQPNNAQSNLEAKHMLLLIIPMIAIATSVLILLAIFSGLQAMTRLRHRYRNLKSPLAETLPPLQGDKITRMTGMAAPVLLPPLFMGVWIFLLMKRLF